MEDRQINNEEVFMKSLAEIDPELWRIKKKLLEYEINPALFPTIIEAFGQILQGSGWGKVEIEIRDYKAIKCRGIDERLVEVMIKD